MFELRFVKQRLVALLGVLFFLTGSVSAASGELSGTLRDVSGNPISNVIVALVREAADALPVLVRTDDSGQLQARGLEAGSYQVSLRSSAYQSPPGRRVEIKSGQTTAVSLVLHQLFALGPGNQQNVSIESLLRAPGERRLVFRSVDQTPAPLETESPDFFDEAVLQVYSSSGSGSDYFIHPGDTSGGMTTNFAVKQSMPTGADYIVAGQLNSGPDSVWRIKNFLDYDFGAFKDVRLTLGYSRYSSQGSSFPLLASTLPGDSRAGSLGAAGTTRILSVGIEDRLDLGSALSLALGVEIDGVLHGGSQYFVNPNAELTYRPFRNTSVQVSLSSKRDTEGNTISLSESEAVNVADAVFFSVIGNRTAVGTSRYQQASVSHLFGDTSLELSAFQTRRSGVSSPVFWKLDGATNVLPIFGGTSDRGYRMSVGRTFSENLRAGFSYLRGEGLGIEQGLTSVDVSSELISRLLRREGYHALAAELEAFIPATRTRVLTLIKAVPSGNPLTTIDPLSDYLETSNQGLNVFVRQLVPMPVSLMRFLGLDFLANNYQLEALFDLRNVTNETLGFIQTAEGNVVLVRNPRAVRGGISVKF